MHARCPAGIYVLASVCVTPSNTSWAEGRAVKDTRLDAEYKAQQTQRKLARNTTRQQYNAVRRAERKARYAAERQADLKAEYAAQQLPELAKRARVPAERAAQHKAERLAELGRRMHPCPLKACTLRVPVRAAHAVPKGCQVSVIAHAQTVMNCVVRRCAQPKTPKKTIPRVLKLRVYKRQPTTVKRAKSHIRPRVGVHSQSGNIQRQQNRGARVGHGAVKGVKKLRRRYAMMRLMRAAVPPCRSPVRNYVHNKLPKVLHKQLQHDAAPTHAAC